MLSEVGLDSNVPTDETDDFHRRLHAMGVDFGASDVQQVTVAKMRTIFQTQTFKAGETDLSHKDYILNWGPGERESTVYTPDLCTEFGIDRRGRAVRLPTTEWPF